jgi:hypothetical protein
MFHVHADGCLVLAVGHFRFSRGKPEPKAMLATKLPAKIKFDWALYVGPRSGVVSVSLSIPNATVGLSCFRSHIDRVGTDQTRST